MFENEDPIESQYMDMKKRLIQKHQKEGDDEEPEFLDSDGDLDFEQLGKKKHIEPLAPIDHSQLRYEEFTRNFYTEHEEIAALSVQQVDKIRKDLQIKVKGSAVCRPIIAFAHLGFDEVLMTKIIA